MMNYRQSAIDKLWRDHDEFWLSRAADSGLSYPAQFQEGSDDAEWHNAAHANICKLVQLISRGK